MQSAELGITNRMDDLKLRTKKFALTVIRFVESLPKNGTCQVLGRQLLRSGTSAAANYRAACRGRSPAEFQAKMGIVEEEADESELWVELLVESGHVDPALGKPISSEASELTAILRSLIHSHLASQ